MGVEIFITLHTKKWNERIKKQRGKIREKIPNIQTNTKIIPNKKTHHMNFLHCRYELKFLGDNST